MRQRDRAPDTVFFRTFATFRFLKFTNNGQLRRLGDEPPASPSAPVWYFGDLHLEISTFLINLS